MSEQLTIADAATRLGVSRRTVYRWIADGTVAAVGRGGDLRVASDDLESITPPTRRRTPATLGDVRRHILEAAATVLAEHGHGQLTIEQVAAAAGMSVGGVTYHFPSKAALLDSLVDAFLELFEREWSAKRAAGASAADAYIGVSLAGRREQRTRAVLLAALEHPATTQRIDRRVKHWYREITRDSDDPDTDLCRCLAADAVWLFGLLGLHPVARARAQDILDAGR